jgi:predicted Fe-Mo cluster-binding NifX family protein
MRFGIPIWRGQVSPVFDVASQLLVIDEHRGHETTRHIEPLGALREADRTRRLAALGVDVLVCGAITRTLEEMIAAAGVEVISLVSGPADRVAGLIVAGRQLPPEYLMPGRLQPRVRGGNHAGDGRHPGKSG